MAPFNTHFLIGEKIWADLEGPWQPYYGQFCFGCVAPDVDKVSAVLTQKDTHFFDRSGPRELMATQRSAAFLEQQATFLGRPFAQLAPEAQAFALGYLCHLCVDEVSKSMWHEDTWSRFKDIGSGAAFAALDELSRRQIERYEEIVKALKAIEVIAVIPRIPPADLAAMLAGVRRFVQAETTEAEYLALVEMLDRPTLEERRQKQEMFRSKIEAARQRVGVFRLETLVEVGLRRSFWRMREIGNWNLCSGVLYHRWWV
jgi:hypothetical protein